MPDVYALINAVLAKLHNLQASWITSGRFGMARMPDMAANKIMVGQGAGNSPVEQNKPVSMPDATAGDTLQVSDDTEGSKPKTQTTYIKVAEVTVGRSGAFRIKFDIKSEGGGEAFYGKVYRDGEAVGADQSNTTTSYVTKSQDISGWTRGDKAQFYVKAGGAGDYGGWYKNFRVYCSLPFEGAGG